MSESEIPSTPAPESAPQEPIEEVQAEESPETTSIEAAVESATTDAKTQAVDTKKEIKAKAAADKTGAEKVGHDKYEIKVDGQVLNVNRDELIKLAQMGKAGQKRMEEYATYKKKVETDRDELIRTLVENPEMVLSHPAIGHDPVKLAKRILAKQMEEEAKDPKDRELEQLRLELQRRDQESQSEKAKMQQERHEQEVTLHAQNIEKEMLSSFDKYELPMNPVTVSKVASILYQLQSDGNNDISIDTVTKYVKDETMSEFHSLLSQLGPDQMETFLGQNVVKTIKDNVMKKYKQAPKVGTTQVAKKTTEDDKPGKKVSIKDWLSGKESL